MRIILSCATLFWLSFAAVAAGNRPVPADFQNPPSMYRTSPFWSWNSALDDEELRWQIREFKDKGFGGYFMHPRVGLVTRYLSEEWFHKVGVCIEEGRRLGLESWLYDEDKWPSGFAGGFTTHDHPEYGAVGMGWKDIAAAEVASALASPQTLGIFELSSGDYRRLQDRAPAAGRAMLFYFQPYQKNNWFNGETYIDVLNPAAVAYFLKLTFADGYDRYFKTNYGKEAPGVFTDEPNYQPGRGRPGTVFPWTPRFPEIFRAQRGYDLLERLPLLVRDLPGYEQVRYDFWRTAAEQFETAFSKPYGEMAEKLGLQFTGHYLAEDTLSSQTNVAGSVMLHYLHQQAPGIDHLQRNIANPLTKKQVSSVAHQFGRDRVLSEIWGVSGHTASFEDLKWMADNHFALGVNFLAPHLTLYAMAGDRKRDYPPTFSYHQPYWPYMKMMNDYVARGAYFVRQGKSAKDVLLLEPLGAVWAHWVPGGRAKPDAVVEQERQFQNAFDGLLALHRDFDLGDEIVIERYGRLEKDRLRVGPDGSYQVVVVPPSSWWNSATVALLDRFLLGGGRVILRGQQPAAMQSLRRHRNAVEVADQEAAMAAALENAAQRDISITDDQDREIRDILYQHRIQGDTHYYFLANMSRDTSYEAKIRVPAVSGSGLVTEWDLSGGTLRTAPLTHVFAPTGSFAFTVERTQAAAAKAVAAPLPVTRSTMIAGPFEFRRMQPNTLVLDSCRYTLNDGPEQGPVPVWKVREAAFNAAGLGAYQGLQPWALEWKGIKPEKTARITMNFEFASELDQPNAWLVVEKIADFQIQLNGRPIGAPKGWHWDKQFDQVDVGRQVRRGQNTIQMITTYKPGVELEDIFLIGDFATKKAGDTKYVLTQEPARLNAGNWVDQGYHFYSGNMVYRTTIHYAAGEHVSLRLHQPMGTAFLVRVGENDAAQLGWRPWQADITPVLKVGDNTLEIVILGSLQNSFGPLHNDQYQKLGNNWWFGPNAFTDTQHWTDAYYHAPYGLSAIEILYRHP